MVTGRYKIIVSIPMLIFLTDSTKFILNVVSKIKEFLIFLNMPSTLYQLWYSNHQYLILLFLNHFVGLF